MLHGKGTRHRISVLHISVISEMAISAVIRLPLKLTARQGSQAPFAQPVRLIILGACFIHRPLCPSLPAGSVVADAVGAGVA